LNEHFKIDGSCQQSSPIFADFAWLRQADLASTKPFEDKYLRDPGTSSRHEKIRGESDNTKACRLRASNLTAANTGGSLAAFVLNYPPKESKPMLIFCEVLNYDKIRHTSPIG
jgi:hypothetical protein